MHRYPDYLLKIISILRKLPGVGTKSAERFAFELIDWPQEKLEEMGQSIGEIKNFLKHCEVCGALIDSDRCPFCDESTRQIDRLCVVGSPKDIFSIEETGQYKALYHVIGPLLSPLTGKELSGATLERLKKRVAAPSTKEVILALDSTLEGDATALFIKKELAHFDVTISRLALGLPMGSSLEYVDGGTLSRALTGRLTY